MNRSLQVLATVAFVIDGLLMLVWVPTFMLMAMNFDDPNRHMTKFDYSVLHVLFCYPVAFIICLIPGLMCLFRKRFLPAFYLGLVPALFGVVLAVLVLLCMKGR